jgi:hypothetical protein
MTQPTLHTTAQAAQLLGLSERQVRHVAGQLGVGTRYGKRALLFSEADIEQLKNRPAIGSSRSRKPQ